MEKKGFFALAGIFLSFLSAPAAFAQLSEPFSNYVVIGAFAYKQNAIRFAEDARTGELDARFDLNPRRNLYYVYVLSSEDRQKAIEEAKRLREQTRYFDTWVYNGDVADHSNFEHPKDFTTQNPVETTQEQFQQEHRGFNPTASQQDLPPAGVTEKPATEKKSLDRLQDPPGRPTFLFTLTRATDRKPLSGKVQLIDLQKSKAIGSFKSSEPVQVKISADNSGQVSAICKLFGYRESVINFDCRDPKKSGITVDDNGNYVIPFELVRLQKGDIAVMYNVYFYKDAGIIRPESKFEVNELVEMLAENPAYKIKIHGHTNGKSAGRIISASEGSNYFSLTDTKEGFGSAKKLSYERANVIRQYLIANGISEDRMEIKPWGGKLPLYDKHHTLASQNVRVEVEILED